MLLHVVVLLILDELPWLFVLELRLGHIVQVLLHEQVLYVVHPMLVMSAMFLILPITSPLLFASLVLLSMTAMLSSRLPMLVILIVVLLWLFVMTCTFPLIACLATLLFGRFAPGFCLLTWTGL